MGNARQTSGNALNQFAILYGDRIPWWIMKKSFTQIIWYPRYRLETCIPETRNLPTGASGNSLSHSPQNGQKNKGSQ